MFTTLRKARALIEANPNFLVVLLSASMLAAALAFQEIGGMPPCPLCVDQRSAHLVAFGLAVGFFIPPSTRHLRWLGALAGGLALLVGAGIAFYHVGVENHWWSAACAVDLGGDGSIASLRERLMSTPLIRCDEIPWSMLGISMAGWNGILSTIGGFLAIGLGLRQLFRRD